MWLLKRGGVCNSLRRYIKYNWREKRGYIIIKWIYSMKWLCWFLYIFIRLMLLMLLLLLLSLLLLIFKEIIQCSFFVDKRQKKRKNIHTGGEGFFFFFMIQTEEKEKEKREKWKSPKINIYFNIVVVCETFLPPALCTHECSIFVCAWAIYVYVHTHVPYKLVSNMLLNKSSFYVLFVVLIVVKSLNFV